MGLYDRTRKTYNGPHLNKEYPEQSVHLSCDLPKKKKKRKYEMPKAKSRTSSHMLVFDQDLIHSFTYFTVVIDLISGHKGRKGHFLRPHHTCFYLSIYISFHNFFTFQDLFLKISSRKHVYIILTPLNPTFI